MKKFLLGIIFTILLGTLSNYTWLETRKEDHPILHPIADFVMWKVVLGQYILDPVMGNCKDQQGENGFGWKFNVADYYGCDRFQRLLNGNLKKPDKNSSKEH